MKNEVDIENWNRKAAFEFFKDYDDPFFNLTANLDVTNLYRFCRKNKLSFSLASLFFSQSAANSVREFRMRLLDGKLVEFDSIDSTQTILNDDESFSFCYFEQRETVFDFERDGRLARDKYKKLKTFDVETERLDLIYYSVIPWLSFTSFKHATRFDKTQTVPRIVFGKYFKCGDLILMPVSVEVNHMIMDGLHVGKFFKSLQQQIDLLKS